MTRDALQVLVDSANEAIATVDGRLGPLALRIGLSNIPDEILMRILESACEYQRDTSNLACVCRRFHAVLLACPRLWSNVSDVMRDEQLEMWLNWSRRSLLDVMLQFGDMDTQTHTGTLEVLKRSSERWGSLSVHYKDGKEWPNILANFQTCSGLTLPSLESLMLSSDFMDVQDEVRPGLAEEDIHFYRSCIMPNLRDLETLNFEPLPLLSGATLRSCRFAYVGEHTTHSFTRLFEFLAACTQLTELVIELSLSNWDDVPSGDPVELHTLEILKLAYDGRSAEDVHTLVQHLHIPNITEMWLRLDFDSDEGSCSNVSRHLEATFPAENSFPLIKDIRVNIRSLPRASPLDIFFTRFPALENLTIEAPQTDPPTFRSDGFPPLKTLHLKNCNKFDRDNLRNIANRMDFTGRERLERLTVECCPELTVPFLEELFPKEKIIWKPCGETGHQLLF